ncbi:MAG: dTDP-4-dehydrorhamnose 3,5-epimerase [Burkholderiaceae bacterium]
MRFLESELAGLFVIDIEPLSDDRGFFARTFCEREFAQRGIEMRAVQSSISFNRRRGTVRGMHFQWPPAREGKLVRCVRGAIIDVVIDLRPESPTFTKHVAVNLDDIERQSLYIPPGLAHGFQTLEDDSEVLYQMSDFYQASLGAGVRWNDPAFEIRWPIDEVTLLERDASYPDFDAGRFALELRAREADAVMK